MGNPNGLRTVLLLTPPMFLLLPISILAFALERISYTLFAVQTTRNWRTGTDSISFYGPTNSSSSSDSWDYLDIDVRINSGPTVAIVGICVAAYVVSVVAMCGIWELRRVEGTASHQRGWSWVVLGINFGIVVASIVVLAWASVLQGQEGWAGYEDVAKDGQRFTRETWVCQINHFYSKQDWAGAACGLSKATRFMLIPLVVSALLVMLSAWILVNDRGGIKWLVGGRGRYGGFESIYEMRPQQQKPQARVVEQTV